MFNSEGHSRHLWARRTPSATQVSNYFLMNLIRMLRHHDQDAHLQLKSYTLRKWNNLTSLPIYFLLWKQRDRNLSGYFQFREGERSNSLYIFKGFLFFCVRYLVLVFNLFLILLFSLLLPDFCFLLLLSHCFLLCSWTYAKTRENNISCPNSVCKCYPQSDLILETLLVCCVPSGFLFLLFSLWNIFLCLLQLWL